MTQAIQLPDGASLAFVPLASLGAAKACSAITNATQGVATLEASHGFVANDIAIAYVAGLKLNNRVIRIASVSTNDLTLEKINTTSTTRFGSGFGVGTFKEVPLNAWVQVPYLKDFQGSGGEQQFVTDEFLDSDDQYEFPSSRTPRRYSVNVGYRGTDAAHFDALVLASENRHEIPFRITYPGGAVTYFLALPTFDPVPSIVKGQTQANALAMACRAEPTVYAAAS